MRLVIALALASAADATVCHLLNAALCTFVSSLSCAIGADAVVVGAAADAGAVAEAVVTVSELWSAGKADNAMSSML